MSVCAQFRRERKSRAAAAEVCAEHWRLVSLFGELWRNVIVYEKYLNTIISIKFTLHFEIPRAVI